MENQALSKFTKRIPIKAAVQTVYNAWATQSGIEQWFLRMAEFTPAGAALREAGEPIQQGDGYVWGWHGYDNGTVEKGKILAANGTDFIQFEFAGSVVSVTMKIEEDETVVELVQDNIPPADNAASSLYIACGEGWTFYLANLKSFLEGGVDLRNKNTLIKRVINS